MTIPVRTLRELFRNLQSWQALYESDGIDTLIAPDGQEYCLHDVRYLYQQSQRLLSPRQAQAIDLFLVQNIREKDVAVQMGVSPSNPVAMYATQGLVRLNALITEGHIARFHSNGDGPASAA